MEASWKDIEKKKPTESGWYQCLCKGNDYRYVMDLYWSGNSFKDNRALRVFNEYEVLAYKDFGQKIKIYADSFCYRDDVVAWRELPNIDAIAY